MYAGDGSDDDNNGGGGGGWGIVSGAPLLGGGRRWMGPWLFFLCWEKFATLDNAVHLRSWVGASEGLECLAGRYRKYIMGEYMGAGRGFALYGIRKGWVG